MAAACVSPPCKKWGNPALHANSARLQHGVPWPAQVRHIRTVELEVHAVLVVERLEVRPHALVGQVVVTRVGGIPEEQQPPSALAPNAIICLRPLGAQGVGVAGRSSCQTRVIVRLKFRWKEEEAPSFHISAGAAAYASIKYVMIYMYHRRLVNPEQGHSASAPGVVLDDNDPGRGNAVDRRQVSCQPAKSQGCPSHCCSHGPLACFAQAFGGHGCMHGDFIRQALLPASEPTAGDPEPSSLCRRSDAPVVLVAANRVVLVRVHGDGVHAAVVDGVPAECGVLHTERASVRVPSLVRRKGGVEAVQLDLVITCEPV